MYYTLDGTAPTESSSLYKGPFAITSNATLQVRAWAAGYEGSGISKAYYQVNADIGAGTGLEGIYYNNTVATGTPASHEDTPDINFNWNGNAPVYGVAGSYWSAEFYRDCSCPGVGLLHVLFKLHGWSGALINGTSYK